MKPGPELDALVAEKVMGWNLIDYPNIGVIEIETEDDSFDLAEFKPSTDIKEAWDVVEFTENNVGGIELISLCDEKKYLFRIWNGKENIEANAETAPLAICLAALKAVGIEVDHD